MIFNLNDRRVKKVSKIADKVLALEPEMHKLSDEELKAKTEEFKTSLKSNNNNLDELLVPAFAVVREAAERVVGLKPYKVQVMGGIVLHQGDIAEMKTGEGKTLTTAFPVYLNALTGEGVHVVTANEYLAERDCDNIGRIFRFLGLKTSCLTHELLGPARKEAYDADIIYGINSEFGFDYLRDNMAKEAGDTVQKPLNFALIDEADSILIDESRTPLVISGASGEDTSMYKKADIFIKSLTKDDYDEDEKDKVAGLTESGIEKAEKYYEIENLSDMENIEINHYIHQALRANVIMKKDIDYIVSGEEILIVDEFTGRIMYGRRFSGGLHQAIEAKEGIEVKAESKTLATVTIQNYFRMYKKLAGMTGTAKTEEDEFGEIYNMNVIVLPTNKPIIRKDKHDAVYPSLKSKYDAILERIRTIHETGQPVLVGTASVEISELLSKKLKKAGIPHNVLNAKLHKQEAEIIADAGKKNAVTIATNMAGRGTDILLGGNPDFLAARQFRDLGYTDEELEFALSVEKTDDKRLNEARKTYKDILEECKNELRPAYEEVKALGGLYVLGTERHEARRIDNQLRGRSGRQGDPGTSEFIISLEDNLIRLFGGDRLKDKANEESEIPKSRLLSKLIENAQKTVEGKNFSMRKNVLQYDDTMNIQRKIIYEERGKVLFGEDLTVQLKRMTSEVVDEVVDRNLVARYPEEWDLKELEKDLKVFSKDFTMPPLSDDELGKMTIDSIKEIVENEFERIYEEKEKEANVEALRDAERQVLLAIIDRNWIDHIDAMEQLKEGIGLRGLGQQNPIDCYQQEGFDMFSEMIKNIREEFVTICYGIKTKSPVSMTVVAGNIKIV